MVNLSALFKIFIVSFALFFSTGLHEKIVVDKAEKEIICLAYNIYYEAGGEEKKGKIAVGNVTMNRVKNKNYPDSVCGVVTQKAKNVCQFSWVCMKKLPAVRKELFKEIHDLSRRIYTGDIRDITKGSTHFHSIEITPPWAETHNVTVEIGNHIFYRK